MSQTRKTPRPPGTAEVFVVGDKVRKVEGRTDLGREGTVTAVFDGRVGGDTLIEVDGNWTAYDRQLEHGAVVNPTPRDVHNAKVAWVGRQVADARAHGADEGECVALRDRLLLEWSAFSEEKRAELTRENVEKKETT